MKPVISRRGLLSGTLLAALVAPVALGKYLQGTSARAPATPVRESVTVFEFMTPGQIAAVRANTASIDVTAACQTALRASKTVIFPAGTYLVDADPERCLSASSNQTISFQPGAILKARGNSLDLYSVLSITNVENVLVEGGEILGERNIHGSSKGEHGMGIAIYNSANVTLREVTCRDCWGDGIYVGGHGMRGKSVNVAIDHCVCENNRRQGLTIAAVDGCRVMGGKFSRSNGVSPAAGIDIEPNYATSLGLSRQKAGVTNVVLDGVECSDNDGHGIALSQVHTTGVRIVSAVAHRNGEHGIACAYVGKDVQIDRPDCQDNANCGISVVGDKAYITRSINITDPVCQGNAGDGIFFGLNVDGFSMIDGEVSSNGRNGILCDGTGGSVCDNGVIHGVSVHSNSRSADRKYDNIRLGALCHHLRVDGNDCKQGTDRNRPRYGIAVTTDEDITIANNDLRSAGAVGSLSGTSLPRVKWSGNVGVANGA